MTGNWEPEISMAWCNSTLKSTALKLDQACFHLQSFVEEAVTNNTTRTKLAVFSQSEKCHECPLWKITSFNLGETATLIVNTTYPTRIAVQTHNQTICNSTYHFGEFGQYLMNITPSKCSEISVETEPANIYLPILWTLLFFIAIMITWGLKCILHDSCGSLWFVNRLPSGRDCNEVRDSETLIPPDTTSIQTEQPVPARHRIRSLDAFRGLTIALMILVNYGGGGYWFLRHAPWNGLTIADIVFPWFVWIMGLSCVLSLNSQLRRALSKKRILWGILRRSVILFLLGLILNSLNNNNIYTLRIPGVLQRLAFVYLVVGVLELMCLDPEDNQRYAWYASIRDVACSWRQWIAVLLLVTTHLLITFYLPIPGCPSGYLGPGGLHRNESYRNCTGGAARVIDVTLFGTQHMYQRPTSAVIYDTSIAFDPEGFLGSLTCVLCAYLGVQAGKILLTFPGNCHRIIRWLVWAVVMGISGGLLCRFSVDGGPIPMNKNLWSVSYVLVSSSSAFFMMALLYYFIDALAWWSGAPLRYAGMNAILLYVAHVLAKPMLPFSWTPLNQTHGAHFALNVTSVIIWISVSWILYRYRVFLSL